MDPADGLHWQEGDEERSDGVTYCTLQVTEMQLDVPGWRPDELL